jgi:hypothetical protein
MSYIRNFSLLNLIRCKYREEGDGDQKYFIMLASPAKGVLFITQNSPQFISGQIRVRGRSNGSYPYNYLEMIDTIFGKEENTIEVCSGNIRNYANSNRCFAVDINPLTKPDLVADGQTLYGISNNRFNRWRCDPPYNVKTAKKMYRTDLPRPIKLLQAGARVCKVGSLMFLLLGPQNYQLTPKGVKRIGWIAITVVPNNEVRALNIFYKYADALESS